MSLLTNVLSSVTVTQSKITELRSYTKKTVVLVVPETKV